MARRIAVLTLEPEAVWARQTPGQSLRWGDFQFVINPSDGVFDACVAYGAAPRDVSIACPPDRTLLIIPEPPSIKLYQPGFLNQFHTVITCHSDTPHPRNLHTQQAYLWYFGVRRTGASSVPTWDYDALTSTPLPAKTKLLSVVISDKAAAFGHRQRKVLVDRLRDRFGDQIDLFGRGINETPDKADAILPYRYHLVLENSQYRDYWTEKLADAFLGGAYPLYWGCPNIADYFPPDALTAVNVYDPEAAAAAIEQAISEDRFSSSVEVRAHARRLVLDVYNVFPFVAGLLAAPTEEPPTQIRLRPEPAFRPRLTLSERLGGKPRPKAFRPG